MYPNGGSNGPRDRQPQQSLHKINQFFRRLQISGRDSGYSTRDQKPLKTGTATEEASNGDE
jgi:hypothetical protein